MSRQRCVNTGAICASILAAAAIVGQAGPLDPPAGPVASSYKTLDQIEPRTPLGPVTTPGSPSALYVISEPGSYYLTGNITGEAGKHGIHIDASGVTLDLMGFTVQGVTDSNDGILASGNDFVVRNGIIDGWGGSGTHFTSRSGVSRGMLVENIQANNNGENGISVDRGGVVRNCMARANGFSGIQSGVNALVESCLVRENTRDGVAVGDGSIVRDCTAFQNLRDGFDMASFSRAIGCVAANNTEEGFDAANSVGFSDCNADNNGFNGFALGTDCVVRGGSASSNDISGVQTADGCVIETCATSGNGLNGVGANSICTVVNVAARANTATGVQTHGVASTIASTGNSTGVSGQGIVISSTSRADSGGFDMNYMKDCLARDCTLWGLNVSLGSRATDNHAFSNERGINTGGINSIRSRNSAVLNTTANIGNSAENTTDPVNAGPWQNVVSSLP